MMYKLFTIIALLTMPLAMFGQKKHRIHGEYTYYMSNHETLSMAKFNAIQGAKVSALEKEFGRTVSATSTSIMDNSLEQDSRFFFLSSTNVKGIWLETIGEPKLKQEIIDDELIITVSIDGYGKAIKSAGIDVDARVLRNGTFESNETSTFYENDNLYLYFKAPSDGYLTVFWLDVPSMKVYCQLPYINSTEPSYKINGDQKYVLFSADNAESPKMKKDVDEIIINVAGDVETNVMYIVFSPNHYSRPATAEVRQKDKSRELSFEEFEEWFSNARDKDSQMVCVTKKLTLQKKNNLGGF